MHNGGQRLGRLMPLKKAFRLQTLGWSSRPLGPKPDLQATWQARGPLTGSGILVDYRPLRGCCPATVTNDSKSQGVKPNAAFPPSKSSMNATE